MAIADLLDLLVCPSCRQRLEQAADARAVHCGQGHSFDLARQGYLNLRLGGPAKSADTPAMVAARDRFLSSGHYLPVRDRLLSLAMEDAPPAARVLEVGAGTGYYVTGVLEGLAEARGIALDVSVPAARRAARADERLASVVADVWQQLPVADQSIDVLLDVFAPRNVAEFERVLHPAGRLLTVTPEPAHLTELRGALGLLDIQPDKDRRLQAALGGAFVQQATESVRFELELEESEVFDLVAMGPNAFHRTEAELWGQVRQVATPARVTVAVRLAVWAVGQPAARAVAN